MNSSKFSRSKLSREIMRRLDKKQHPDKISREIGAYLVERGKTAELNSLLRDCMQYRADKKGVIEVLASSAFPLTSAHKQTIEKIAREQYKNAKEIIIQHRTDSSLVGGITLTFPNSSIDMSIRAKLNKLRMLTN